MPRGIEREAAAVAPRSALARALQACSEASLPRYRPGLTLTIASPFVVALGEQCDAKDAVYLQAASGAQQGISLFFVCCQCNHMWVDARPCPTLLLRCWFCWGAQRSGARHAELRNSRSPLDLNARLPECTHMSRLSIDLNARPALV